MCDRWYEAALVFVNKVRLDLQLPPLKELETGHPGSDTSCPISNSIRKDGYDKLIVLTNPYLHGPFGSSSIPGSVEVGTSVSTRRRVYILKADVSHFVRRFDNGYYKKLIQNENN